MNRTDLQALFESILGSRNVYFQPPENLKMSYPAIVYSLESINNTRADDAVYLQSRGYSVTVIDRNPDSTLVSAISKLPYCRFSRHFKSDNLNHFVFTIHI